MPKVIKIIIYLTNRYNSPINTIKDIAPSKI